MKDQLTGPGFLVSPPKARRHLTLWGFRAGLSLNSLAVILLVTTAAWADSVVLVPSQAAQNANDSVSWSQLGSDGTSLPSAFDTNSIAGTTVSVALSGPNSLLSVVCPSSSCSWAGIGLAAGDTLFWTSDGHNGGNGPIALSFSKGVAGVGAFIQADSPLQFTAQIQAFSGSISLGTFTATSDPSGRALYLGVLDSSGTNISSIVLSLAGTSQGVTTDFVTDTLYLNSSLVATPTVTATQTATAVPTATRGAKATPTSKATPKPRHRHH